MRNLLLLLVLFPNLCLASGLEYYEKLMRSAEFKAYVPKEYGVEMKFQFNNNPVVLGNCSEGYNPDTKCVFIDGSRIVAFDDQQKIAVIKSEFSFGGSGIAIVIYILDASTGKILTSDPIYLGDRIIFENVKIESKTIIVEYVGHGRGDASCCPTKKMRQKFICNQGHVRRG